MKKLGSFFLKKVKTIRKYLFLSKEEKEIIAYVSFLNKKLEFKKPSEKILVQGILDYNFILKQFFLSHFYSKKLNARIDLILFNTSYSFPGSNYKGYAGKFMKIITEKKIRKLYGGFLPDSILSFSKSDLILKKRIEKESQEIFSKLKSKRDLLEIKIKNIQVGDLVYDTYLRDGKQPEVKIDDPLLLEVLKSAFQIYYSIQGYLEKNNTKLLLTSYTTYIYHGILVRELLDRGVSVYSFSSKDQLLRKIKKDFPFHVKDYTNYKNEFDLLEDKEIKLELAKEKFLKRFSGEIDSAIFYMKGSSFSGSGAKELSAKLNGRSVALVMLHCFFDSPHIYRSMLFPDFIDWFVFIMEEAKKLNNIEFIVKPHPNGLPENEEIISRLKKRFPNTIFVEKTISNHALINEINIKAVFTVYGTVSHEFPYFGIPVINAGDNPHINYSFSFNPKNLNEFKDLIHNVCNLKINNLGECRKEILEFYYMHNIHSKGKLEENDILGIDNLGIHGADSSVLKKFLEKNWGERELEKALIHIKRADLSIC